VPFTALHNLPLVHFCRPNSWRNHLEELAAEHGITLNVVLEADSITMQTHVAADSGIYALLGPYAISSAMRTVRVQSSRIVKPSVSRHIALAMSRHGEMTLACRTVMQILKEIAKSGASGLPVA
jgi:DNA-binding transcriptional LysR family regulator